MIYEELHRKTSPPSCRESHIYTYILIQSWGSSLVHGFWRRIIFSSTILSRLDWFGREGSCGTIRRHGLWSLHPSRWTWPMKLAAERSLMCCWWTQALAFWWTWWSGDSLSFATFWGCGNCKATMGGHVWCMGYKRDLSW